MLYAIIDNEKEKAVPGVVGICPHCEGEMIPKCGEINQWHWAHKNKSVDCLKEPETEWHRNWKLFGNKRNVEVRIKKGARFKITDMKLKCGYHVEFQNSPIDVREIREREAFYKKMIWVFNCIEPYESKRLFLRKKSQSIYALRYWIENLEHISEINKRIVDDNFYTIKWKYPRKTIEHTSMPTYLDFGEEAFRLIYFKDGWGYGFLSPRKIFSSFLAKNS
jgi:competence protein CoiA